MVKLSIVVIHHNDIDDLKSCLKQLKNQTFTDFEVIIIDNGSDFNRKVDLYIYLEKFKIFGGFDIKLFYQSNKGYPGGMNSGIKKSLGDLILISNTDIFFGSSFLEDAIKYMNNYDIMGPKIYYYPDTDKIWSVSGFFDFNNFQNQEIKNEKIDEICEVDYISGCCMFIKREVFKKIKLFDENYFIYMEDSDFCYRAKQIKLKVIYYPKIVVFHNITEEREKQSEFMKINYFRSKLIFIFKHYTFKQLTYCLPVIILISLISFLKSKIKNRLIKSLKVIINGLVLGLKLRFRI